MMAGLSRPATLPNKERFSLADFREAREGLIGVAVTTPIIPLLPADSFPFPVGLKAEFQQSIGAFKIRGAWTAIRRLDPETRAKGVVTTSSGNHGQGIAAAAQRFGIPAVIVMPGSAAQVKIDGVRRLGAEVILAGATRGPEQDAAAAKVVAERGMTLVPPYDHFDVIAGQGTVAMEIFEQWPDVSTIVVPIGGGGLLSGISAAVRALRPETQVIAVEPALIPKLSTAVKAGERRTIDPGTSLADGLLTRSVGELTWPLIQPTVQEVVGVTDQEIMKAMQYLADRDLRVEPSGAATTAALLAGKIQITGPTVLIASGGNVDDARYQDLIAK